MLLNMFGRLLDFFCNLNDLIQFKIFVLMKMILFSNLRTIDSVNLPSLINCHTFTRKNCLKRHQIPSILI